MRQTMMLTTFTTMLIVQIAAAAPPSAHSFTGRVRDIDYLGDHVQVIASGTSPNSELVANTKTASLQAVLETALATGRPAEISYSGVEPRLKVTGVKLSVSGASPVPGAPCTMSGCVQEIECTASSCTARILGHSGVVSTKSGSASGILLTAIQRNAPVSELMTDDHGVITRVKINVP